MWEALRCREPITIIAVGLGIIRPDPLTGILTLGMKKAGWWLPHHSLHPREAWYPWPLQFHLSLAQPPSAVKAWPWNSYLILQMHLIHWCSVSGPSSPSTQKGTRACLPYGRRNHPRKPRAALQRGIKLHGRLCSRTTLRQTLLFIN